MVLFEPDDYWGVRQDKCMSPFCRQENGNQSGCQEMVRAGAPAIYSGHLCVSSFSIPAFWAGDSTDRWVGPCRWGGGFRSGDGGQPPGLSSFRTSECAQAPHQHHLYKTLPDVSCGYLLLFCCHLNRVFKHLQFVIFLLCSGVSAGFGVLSSCWVLWPRALSLEASAQTAWAEEPEELTLPPLHRLFFFLRYSLDQTHQRLDLVSADY